MTDPFTVKRRDVLSHTLAGAAALAWPWRAAGAQLPTDLRFIVPSPPAGGPDVVVRTLAQEIERTRQVNVVVQNHGGANGELGVKRFLAAPPDGSTWLLAWDSVVMLNPLFYPREHSAVLHGLWPVAMVANTASCFIVVHANDEIQRFDDLLALSRQAAIPLAYGTGGTGSMFHVMTEEMAAGLQLRVRHVPYRGNTQALNDLLAGQLRFVMAGISALPLVQAGRLRALAVTAPQRQPAFPHLPAISEYLPGFELVPWFGLFGSRGVAPAQFAQMSEWVDQVLRAESYRRLLAQRGDFSLQMLAGDAFAQHIERQHRQLAAVVARWPKEKESHVQ
jgi:tripartite-type tricarboxylate transporter receptor subunit TctC